MANEHIETLTEEVKRDAIRLKQDVDDAKKIINLMEHIGENTSQYKRQLEEMDEKASLLLEGVELHLEDTEDEDED